MGFDRPRSGGFGGRSGGSRGGFGGGRGRSFGGDRGGFGGGFRDRSPREMHDAICTKCKKECQVPFRPTGDKPVLCSDCFRDSDSGSRGSSRNGSSGGMSQEQFKTINTKLDKILEVLDTIEFEDEEGDEEENDAGDEEEAEELVEEEESSDKNEGEEKDNKDSKEDLDEDIEGELDEDSDEESPNEPKTA